MLEAVNPLATVEIIEYVWNKLGGYHYYAADISRRGKGWLLPDDVIEVKSNEKTKKATITAISYLLSKRAAFQNTLHRQPKAPNSHQTGTVPQGIIHLMREQENTTARPL